MIPIFLINLKQSVERRKYVTDQLEKLGLSYNIFDAYLGKDYYKDKDFYDEKKALKFEHRKLKIGEVGCSLSHNAIYNKIVKDKIPYALILEDDIILNEKLPLFLENIEKHLKGNMVINISRCDVYKKKNQKKVFENFYLVSPRYIKYGGIACACGYIVTLDAAKIMQDYNKPVYFPADAWGYYLNKVNFYGIIPTLTLITQNVSDFYSTIQSDGIGIYKGKKESSALQTSTKFVPHRMLMYHFKTKTILGRFIASVLRPFYRFLKKLLKK